ncbi:MULTISPECIES: hypothetical protein [unclassified Microcoleus]|uniref:hypothetical protein n=1 Tax=unclassified Microcoleus TaxID=2642155 RepID=UPI002FD60432
MTDYNPRRYRERYKLEKEGSELKPYYVKVSALSGVPLAGTDEISNTYWEKYKTPPYDTTTEAFTHAYGWVDGNLCDEDDLDQNGEPCKRAYEKLRKDQEEFYKSRTPEEKVESHMEEEKAWEKKLEEAYKAGWADMLQ